MSDSVQVAQAHPLIVEMLFEKEDLQSGWSIARLHFKDRDAIGLRWNVASQDVEEKQPDWFIVPPELAGWLVRGVDTLSRYDEAAMLEGYRAMAADEEREKEALEWSEGLVGDAYEAG